MTKFKEDFAKIPRDQQLEYIRQANEVVGQQPIDEQGARDAQLIQSAGELTDNEFEALKRRMIREGDRAAADRQAEKAAKARGFSVSK